MSVNKWQERLYSWSPSTFSKTDYVPLKGKRSILVPSGVDIKGSFSFRRRGFEHDLYDLVLIVRVVECSPVIRFISFGFTNYKPNTPRYELTQLEPSITDFDLRAINLQSLATRLISKVSLTNKVEVKYIDDIEEFERQVRRGVHGIAFGDKPLPVFTDSKGVSWYKTFVYETLDKTSKALNNSPRRTAARPSNKQVATDYKEAQAKGVSIYKFFEGKYDTSQKNVERWISDAKEAGLIPKTKAGRPRKVGK